VSAGTTAGESNFQPRGEPLPKLADRSPLAYLLHALNQPLTGLQCAMEVALGRPRTPEQYVQGLREGLGLTERMRSLVEAIREVMDLEEDKSKAEERETFELRVLLREVLDDLEPVAEVKAVRMLIEGAEHFPMVLKASRRRMAGTVFRTLESALSLAAQGSEVLVETSGASSEGWIRVGWLAAGARAEFSRPELGLVVAQAGWEQASAEWERERMEDREAVTIRLSGARQAAGIPNLSYL
jgi:hypothetical protein